MARVKGGMSARRKHNKVLKLAKGYRGARSKQYRVAKPVSYTHLHQREAYTTIPLGLILVNDVLLTVCAEATPVLKNFLENTVKEFSTKKQMRFIYQIFLRSCMPVSYTHLDVYKRQR